MTGLRVTALTLLCLAIARSGLAFSTDGCKWPSEFWCDDSEIAEACGVSWQCEVLKQKQEQSRDAPPVDIALYYESLCPGCLIFISTQLKPVYQNLSSIMNVTLVPYGNAKETFVDGHWHFECQHGNDECVGNLIETCALNLYDQPTAFDFVFCVEENSGGASPEQAAKQCASQQPKVNLTRVMACAQSEEGEKLEHQMAILTDSLVPQHTYVPWITLYGKHNEIINRRAQTNLFKLVCQSYQGPKPAPCQQEALPVSIAVTERDPFL